MRFWKAFLDGLAALAFWLDDYDQPMQSGSLADDWHAVAGDMRKVIETGEGTTKERA